MTLKHLLFGLPVAAACFGLVACDVETVEEGQFDLPEFRQTEEGNLDMPEVDVRGGDVSLPEYEQTREGNIDLPEYDVTTPDVDVNTGTRTIEVPTADVDVTMPDEQSDAVIDEDADTMRVPDATTPPAEPAPAIE